jgi:hypothetical protein
VYLASSRAALLLAQLALAGIHVKRQRLWKHLRPEVKEWTLAKWARFEWEQPDGFDAALISQVEDDMIPPDSLEGLARAGSLRRKSSVGERIIGLLFRDNA